MELVGVRLWLGRAFRGFLWQPSSLCRLHLRVLFGHCFEAAGDSCGWVMMCSQMLRQGRAFGAAVQLLLVVVCQINYMKVIITIVALACCPSIYLCVAAV
jgi:hypothetical protein